MKISAEYCYALKDVRLCMHMYTLELFVNSYYGLRKPTQFSCNVCEYPMLCQTMISMLAVAACLIIARTLYFTNQLHFLTDAGPSNNASSNNA